MPLGQLKYFDVLSTTGRCAAILFMAFVFALAGCGKSGGGGGGASGGGASAGLAGVYTALDQEEITIEFKSGGVVVFSAQGMGESAGSYVMDGERIIVTNGNQKTTFIRDGNCIEDNQNNYGKLCKGGKAGEAANVSTRNVPSTPTGIWIANNADGEFKIEFKDGSKLTLAVTPAPGVPGKPGTLEGKFEVEGDKVHVIIPSMPMVLKFVNNGYESQAYGLPLKFVKQ